MSAAKRSPHWTIDVLWSDGNRQARTFEVTSHLKDYLLGEVFCLEHGCPLPIEVRVVKNR